MSEPPFPPHDVRAVDLPALVAARSFATWRDANGSRDALGADEAVRRARAQPPVLCHGPATARRLGSDHIDGYDVLELFAFVRPAEFTLPTIQGLARTLGITEPEDADALIAVADRLLTDLADDRQGYEDAAGIARALQRAGWLWAPFVLAALDTTGWPDNSDARVTSALAVWREVPEWGETAPEPPPGNEPVSEEEARNRLALLLGGDAESREGQRDYAAATAAAFAPRPAADSPNIVLAEAGTGTGKTLGYIAPASIWSEKNAGPVWISTYTRNLQQQIDQELSRLYPDPDEKARHVVIRKGRENYLCLLNLEDAAGRFTTLQRRNALGVALTARWVQATRDGDLGGDFPAWLVDLVGVPATLGLSDRRGECIYSACSHYNRCFVEHSVRKARKARLVVANHALVMIQAALGGGDDANVPSRYVFDEGHHIFDAADSAFAAHLSGREMAELRRWLLGNEGSGRRRPGGRSRGLRERAEDLIAADDTAAADALAAALDAAQILPAPGWLNRLSGAMTEGPAESFLAEVREQVFARAKSGDGPYSLETEVRPPSDGMPDAAAALREHLVALATPLRKLCARLIHRLDADADELDSATRVRIEAVARALQRRAEMLIGAWIDMLDAIDEPASKAFVDWIEVERIDGRELDAGLYRHWVDPTMPFAEAMAPIAHGMVFTSATLTDRTGDSDTDWASADARTGASHFPAPAVHARVASPFDYAAQTRVFVVTDVRRNDADQMAAAMRELFVASGGGGLGLFTSIARLRQVHARMADALDAAGLPLYAQHVDSLNVATLIDIFRAETDACLLGTDAVRDGVDVPGRSLRMLAFDRIPWPRPTILHRARREAFGGRNHDDLLARLRLAQAYGRLIRRKGDKGVFVILDAATPTRLFGAFPEEVVPERVGLVDAIEATEEFLAR
ncbi:MAG: ATP-dependent DNA helicase [Rhodospirillaceae bacterium]|jgi:ATP-dependent DNA helicase DinG|nr:ATP-dependent DNA helicase [Rhodospirillaceae bacterium]MBT5359450.1 ATP-dependent DNA helicase [Rhodospirillaceae bacterium]MBT5768357.1 ATP-dependent DNA helicase [Rhodospirillaceae bacterium]MBT6309612.1 ATP-dependent DNA helicase [Rhodospirillaceae bacterium]MBT7363711.1 ATP-dependent DNA helicase [Rhodospirillaceae bacterium]